MQRKEERIEKRRIEENKKEATVENIYIYNIYLSTVRVDVTCNISWLHRDVILID